MELAAPEKGPDACKSFKRHRDKRVPTTSERAQMRIHTKSYPDGFFLPGGLFSSPVDQT